MGTWASTASGSSMPSHPALAALGLDLALRSPLNQKDLD
jgi:hypothetical protein